MNFMVRLELLSHSVFVCVSVSRFAHTVTVERWLRNNEKIKNFFKLKSIFLRRDELKVGQPMMSGIFSSSSSLSTRSDVYFCSHHHHDQYNSYRICIVHVCYVIIIARVCFSCFCCFFFLCYEFLLDTFLRCVFMVWAVCVIKASILFFLL